MIELCQTPIYKSQLQAVKVIQRRLSTMGRSHLASLVIDHNVVWLHIAMHDTLGMAEIQGLPRSEIRWQYVKRIDDTFKSSSM